MTVERTRILSRILIAAGAALLLVGVSGCAAETVKAEQKPSARPSVTAPSPSPDPAASAAAIDKVTCATYSDMLTIMVNADAAFQRGGIGPQERTGWYTLALRVIGRAPSSGEGAVAEALATLKGIQPSMSTDMSTQDPASVAWGRASMALAAACNAEGFAATAEGFVGG